MSNNKLKLTGLGSMVLIGEKIDPEKEYLISIRAELKEITKNIEDKDDPFYTFIMVYLNTELVQCIGESRQLKVEHGKTMSQKIRWALEALGEKKGIDKLEYYESEQKKRLDAIMNELEE